MRELEEVRRNLPVAASRMTQLVVDNPGQFALLVAGTIVTARAAQNLVRPRTAVQALALAVILQVGMPALAMQAVRRGWVTIRIRDEDGNLVPLLSLLEPGSDG